MSDDDKFRRLARNLDEARAWRADGCPPGPVDMGRRALVAAVRDFSPGFDDPRVFRRELLALLGVEDGDPG